MKTSKLLLILLTIGVLSLLSCIVLYEKPSEDSNKKEDVEGYVPRTSLMLNDTLFFHNGNRKEIPNNFYQIGVITKFDPSKLPTENFECNCLDKGDIYISDSDPFCVFVYHEKSGKYHLFQTEEHLDHTAYTTPNS